jgi:hypothetical protein
MIVLFVIANMGQYYYQFGARVFLNPQQIQLKWRAILGAKSGHCAISLLMGFILGYLTAVHSKISLERLASSGSRHFTAVEWLCLSSAVGKLHFSSL